MSKYSVTCIVIILGIKWKLPHDSASIRWPVLQGVLTIRLIDTMGVRPGLLFCKLTLANLAIMLAPVKEAAFCLMLFTEGF